ncbi:response regulator [bacterium]|nr:response regulator [bacterium]
MIKILVVDDSSGWVRHHVFNIKHILGEENVEVLTAYSAREADDVFSANVDNPFNFVFTDMQMETDFLPLNAGEWVIKQAQFYPEYKNTRIVIVSASPVIEKLAEKYGVEFIPKRLCQTTEPYTKILLG